MIVVDWAVRLPVDILVLDVACFFQRFGLLVSC